MGYHKCKGPQGFCEMELVLAPAITGSWWRTIVPSDGIWCEIWNRTAVVGNCGIYSALICSKFEARAGLHIPFGVGVNDATDKSTFGDVNRLSRYILLKFPWPAPV